MDRTNGEKFLLHDRYCIKINDKFIPFARFVWDCHNPSNKWKKGQVIHHKDENTLNDSIDNLDLLSISEHMRFHKTKERNPWYGKKLPKSITEKMSSSRSGEKNYWYNKHRSEETKIKISNKLKGIKRGPLSDSTKKKLSEVKMGHLVSKETRAKLSETLKGRGKGKPKPEGFGKKLSEIKRNTKV